MRSRVLLLAGLLFVLSGCGSQGADTAQAAQARTVPVINWQTLGCAEPAAPIVESSPALEEDVGLAAPSLADRYGLAIEEAQRRLRLQEVHGQAMLQVQAAEAGRVARLEIQHEPRYAAIVTLTGAGAVSDTTREILCQTPELEVRLDAAFTQDELVNETVRLAPIITDAVRGLASFGPGDGELRFDVVDDASRDQLDALLQTLTIYPYSIFSQGLPPLVIDPIVPFPLLDTTGRASMTAGLSGVLVIEGPCVYVADILQVLPARETQWDPVSGVLNTGSGDMRSGDNVTGGGGPYAGAIEDLDQPPDPSCRIENGLFVGTFAPALADPNATPAPIPPSSANPAPPEPPDSPLFSLNPSNPQAGELFEATFELDNQRGGFFHLSRWQGSDWSVPQFLLESGANSGTPTVFSIEGEGVMMEDYGAGGAGPDELLMPADIEPGQWRLCTANAGQQICTQITVDSS